MKVADQLAEDRALRDAALELFKADLRFIREDLQERGIGQRVTERVGDSAKELADDALSYAGEHKSIVAAAIAAVVLWFARSPIMQAVEDLFGSENDDEGEPKEAEQHPPARRSSQRSIQSSGDQV